MGYCKYDVVEMSALYENILDALNNYLRFEFKHKHSRSAIVWKSEMWWKKGKAGWEEGPRGRYICKIKRLPVLCTVLICCNFYTHSVGLIIMSSSYAVVVWSVHIAFGRNNLRVLGRSRRVCFLQFKF